jgi:hypothetical protein
MNSRMKLNHKRAGRVRQTALVLLVFTLPLFLGAWKIVRGRDINPAYVDRIQDGKTKKHEILTLFGDPDEIDRTPEGTVYIYKTFREKTALPKKERKVLGTVQDSPYFDEDWLKNKASRKPPGKELVSMLVIRFGRDGETVQNHNYKQY